MTACGGLPIQECRQMTNMLVFGRNDMSLFLLTHVLTKLVFKAVGKKKTDMTIANHEHTIEFGRLERLLLLIAWHSRKVYECFKDFLLLFMFSCVGASRGEKRGSNPLHCGQL